MSDWVTPSTRSMAASSSRRCAKARAASATATALSSAASKATRWRNLPARSKVCCISGRPDSRDSTRTPRTSANSVWAIAQALYWAMAGAVPVRAKRQATRLAGCTKPVAARSSAAISTRGAKFMKPAPRSGSRNNTWLSTTRCWPSHSGSPGFKPKASKRDGSAQASPEGGPLCCQRSAGASSLCGNCEASPSRPRKG